MMNIDIRNKFFINESIETMSSLLIDVEREYDKGKKMSEMLNKLRNDMLHEIEFSDAVSTNIKVDKYNELKKLLKKRRENKELVEVLYTFRREMNISRLDTSKKRVGSILEEQCDRIYHQRISDEVRELLLKEM